MLTMLEVTEERYRGPVKRLLGRMIPPRVEARMSSLARSPFLRITAERYRGRVDWRMVCAHTLDPAGRLLMPIGETPPEGVDLRRFTPTSFLRRLRENLALELLAASHLPPAKRSIALYGQEAELSELLPRLVPLAGEVRIITHRPYAIRDCAEQISGQTGLPVMITDLPDASGCQILLAPSGGARSIYARDVKVVISPDQPVCETSRRQPVWVHTVGIKLPEILTEEYSDHYDILEFAGAFYEIAGLHELGRIIPDSPAAGEINYR